MSSNRARARLSFERLEGRLALSAGPAAVGVASPAVVVAPPGDTLAVLTAFTRAYRSHAGEPNYVPALDLNHNRQIGQEDGKLLLRALPPLSPNVPLQLKLAISPRDSFQGHHGANSGGATYNQSPTVIGHTTPGALVFTGSGTVDLKLRGPAYVADARGNFSLKVNLADGINQFNVLIVDAYGHQTLRAFPILWLGFAKYEAAHPRKT